MHGYDWMPGYGPGYGYGFGGLFMLLFWVLLVVIAAAAAGWAFRLTRGNGGGSSVEERPALRLLEERYARGEIGREEFLAKKKDIEG